jgi:hypothetical protein
MRRPSFLWVVFAALAGAAACGYPSFSYSPVVRGSGSATSAGSGGAESTSSGGLGGRPPASGGGGAGGKVSTSSAGGGGSGGGASSATTGGGGGDSCTIGHLLIGEILSRGPNGGSDEFIELYNPTRTAVVLDGSWAIDGSPVGVFASYSTRWIGTGRSIPPHGHYLIVGSDFSGGVYYDDTLLEGISDAASLRLLQCGNDVDVVCYYHADDCGTEQAEYADPVGGFDCEGTPVANPHDDTSGTDVNESIARRPGGLAGNCTDTHDNAADFVEESPSTPESSKSPPAP